MERQALTPYQQEIYDLIADGWTVSGHDLELRMRWCAYVAWAGNNGRKWPRASIIKTLVEKGYITIEPDPINLGYFVAKIVS